MDINYPKNKRLTKLINFTEHLPFGWWYSPKYKPTQNGYFVGFKESVEYVKDVLMKHVSLEWIRKNKNQIY